MANIGVDIVAINRIESILSSDKKIKFLNKIFSENEILESKEKANMLQYFSGRFAAKEAIRKALSSEKKSTNQSFKSIEILNSDSGKPYVLSETRKDINISISHDGNYAVAFCIIDK
ncbi:holo-ACP synthase [Candidatus Marinimicrobia bacterium]|nr:holo-ACP synthase [Candidatus Neomarinimicrobiota bacterium]